MQNSLTVVKPVKLSIPSLAIDGSDKVKLSYLKNLDQNLVNFHSNTEERFEGLNRSIEKAGLENQAKVNRTLSAITDSTSRIEGSNRSVVEKFNELREQTDHRDTRLTHILNDATTAIQNIRKDRIENIREIVGPTLQQLEDKLTPVSEIPQLKEELKLALFVFKELKTTLENYSNEFNILNEITSILKRVENKSIDPEIKFYYSSFTEKLDEFEKMVSAISVLEKTYNEKIDFIENDFNLLVSNINQLGEILKGSDDKNVVINQTVINEIQFVQSADLLPDAKYYRGKEIFAKKTVIRNWKLYCKGSYISDGIKWFRH